MKKLIAVVGIMVLGLSLNGVKVNAEDSLETEEQSEYVTLLETFIESGAEAFAFVGFEESDLEGYEFKLVISIEEALYEVYYNVDDLGQAEGIIIFDNVEYTIQPNGEADPAHAPLNDESALVFVAVNGEDSIQIVYTTCEDLFTTSVKTQVTVAGEVTNTHLSIKEDEGEYRLRISEKSEMLEFKAVTEDEAIIYTLTYRNGPESIIVTATPVTDEEGNMYYEFSEIIKTPSYGTGRPENPGKSEESNGLKLGHMMQNKGESEGQNEFKGQSEQAHGNENNGQGNSNGKGK